MIIMRRNVWSILRESQCEANLFYNLKYNVPDQDWMNLYCMNCTLICINTNLLSEFEWSGKFIIILFKQHQPAINYFY